MRAATSAVLFGALALLCVCALPMRARVPPDEAIALCKAAIQRYHAAEYPKAEELLHQAIGAEPAYAMARYWLGMVYLAEGRTGDARGQFRKVVGLDPKSADGHYGLGLAYAQAKHRRLEAMSELGRALELFPEHVDARYQRALLLIEAVGGPAGPLYIRRARDDLNEVIQIDPEHPGAYYDLAFTYDKFSHDLGRATDLYLAQLRVNPAHAGAVRGLGSCYMRSGRLAEGISEFSALSGRSDTLRSLAAPEILRLQAAHRQRRGDFDGAMAAYEQLFTILPPEETAPYFDLSNVASDTETQEYNDLPEARRSPYWAAFWKQRDPLPATPVNERLVEHYRRVNWARECFSEGCHPWDTRGKIYVRFGEPDDRSAVILGSGEELSDGLAPTAADAGVGSIRERNVLTRYRMVGERGPRRVESWVYVRFDAEFIFVDRKNSGAFDFPLPQMSTDIEAIAREAQYSPAAVAEDLISKVPESYAYDYGGPPMAFVFDFASYWGKADSSLVEVSCLVPYSQLGRSDDGLGEVTSLSANVVLFDDTWEEAARADTATTPFHRPTGAEPKGWSKIFQLSFLAHPGVYHASVEVREEVRRAIGIYKTGLVVRPYVPGQLGVSDIRLATEIVPNSPPGLFVRDGIKVVPNPTRSYGKGLPVYVYYEIYNLTPDEFGRVRYRTEVTIATTAGEGLVSDIARAMGRLVGRSQEKGAVTLVFENASEEPTQFEHMAVDMATSPPGEYALTVRVVDLNSGRQAASNVGFAVSD